jgi:hypothetical protein
MQRGQGRGTAVCDNMQTAVDAQPTLMVAGAVTHAPGDRAWLRPLARQAQAGRDGPGAAGRTPSGSRPSPSANAQLGLVSQADCTSHPATDTSPGPAGAPRTSRVAPVELGRPLRYDATGAGRGGAIQQPCRRNTGGRRLTRWGEEQWLDELAPRGRRRPEGRPRRQARVEPPCGTMKRGGAHGYLLRRGREQGRTACRWTGLADNLRRVLHRRERPRRLATRGGVVPVRRAAVWAGSTAGRL